MYMSMYIYIFIHIFVFMICLFNDLCTSVCYLYGKCLGFAQNRNHDRQRIIIIIIIIIKPLLKILNECRSLTGWEN